MFALPGYIGFIVNAGVAEVVQRADLPGSSGDSQRDALMGNIGSTTAGAQGASRDFGTAFRSPWIYKVGGTPCRSRTTFKYGPRTTAQVFAWMLWRGRVNANRNRAGRARSVSDVLSMIERWRERGEFMPLPHIDLSDFGLSPNEEVVLCDFVKTVMQHLEVAHRSRVTYSMRYSAGRTGLDEVTTYRTLKSLVRRGLIERVGTDPKSGAFIYAARDDIANSVVDSLARARSEWSRKNLFDNEPKDVDDQTDVIENDTDDAQSERTETRTYLTPPLSVTPGPRRCSGPRCSNDISHLRADAKTCGRRCRTALSRSKRKILEAQGTAGR
jgi:hypothetical protein